MSVVPNQRIKPSHYNYLPTMMSGKQAGDEESLFSTRRFKLPTKTKFKAIL